MCLQHLGNLEVPSEEGVFKLVGAIVSLFTQTFSLSDSHLI